MFTNLFINTLLFLKFVCLIVELKLGLELDLLAK